MDRSSTAFNTSEAATLSAAKRGEIASIVPVGHARLTLTDQQRTDALLRLATLLKDKPSLVEDEDSAMALANELAEDTYS